MEVINEGGLVKLWADGVHVEDSARAQLARVSRLPFIHKHVAAMPDAHMGIGATIGSVIPTTDAIVPAAVGVDIGCGIAGWRTEVRGEDLNDANLANLRADLERAIPHGRTDNGGPNDRGAWGETPWHVAESWRGGLEDRFNEILETTPVRRANAARHLGTLGTGNHFIEYALDREGFVWILCHSGSRGAGAAIANHWIKQAKLLCAKWHVRLEDPNLAFLPQGTPEFDAYMKAMFWAQAFAAENRRLMLESARRVLSNHLGLSPTEPPIGVLDRVETPHNFVARERHFGEDVWVTRKGACRAREGDRVVIPGSMGEATYVVTGKGCRDAFESCSHGAGRAMSRTEARKRFDLDHHLRVTSHVECRKDAGVLDETPGSYKPIDAVIAAQADLVQPTHWLIAFVNMKG